MDFQPTGTFATQPQEWCVSSRSLRFVTPSICTPTSYGEYEIDFFTPAFRGKGSGGYKRLLVFADSAALALRTARISYPITKFYRVRTLTQLRPDEAV